MGKKPTRGSFRRASGARNAGGTDLRGFFCFTITLPGHAVMSLRSMARMGEDRHGFS